MSASIGILRAMEETADYITESSVHKLQQITVLEICKDQTLPIEN